ncbi:hypothetical protein M885DRAFT_610017, partial [Pelagophyceae sp. CCMP2097]
PKNDLRVDDVVCAAPHDRAADAGGRQPAARSARRRERPGLCQPGAARGAGAAGGGALAGLFKVLGLRRRVRRPDRGAHDARRRPTAAIRPLIRRPSLL